MFHCGKDKQNRDNCIPLVSSKYTYQLIILNLMLRTRNKFVDIKNSTITQKGQFLK